MPQICYSYFRLPGELIPRPFASGAILNPNSGEIAPIVALLDTGADSTTLTWDLLAMLNIDPTTLPHARIKGIDGVLEGEVRWCNFLQVGLIDTKTITSHFPNKTNPVPLYFSKDAEINLFGRGSFLDLCDVRFDGPKGLVTLDF